MARNILHIPLRFPLFNSLRISIDQYSTDCEDNKYSYKGKYYYLHNVSLARHGMHKFCLWTNHVTHDKLHFWARILLKKGVDIITCRCLYGNNIFSLFVYITTVHPNRKFDNSTSIRSSINSYPSDLVIL